MASFKDNPVLAELDSIAMELEKTGNADLATLVDECSNEIIAKPQKKASTKTKPAPKRNKRRSKKNRKSAQVAVSRNRSRVAAAMKKIARAQVAELEDIAAELIREGQKTAALEVLKIAEDLDSDYDYSKQGDHDEPEHKGDADKRYDREKNLPKPKGDDAKLDYTWEEGEGYPFNDGEKSAFAQQIDELIRLAEEGAEDMDLGDEEDHEEPDEDDFGGPPDGDEDDDDMPDMEDMGDEMEDEDDDELASMLDAMGLGEDMEASSDRMYGADEDMDMGEEGDDLDLGDLDMGEEEGDDMDLGDEDMDDDEEGDDLALDDEDDMDMGDEPAMDEDDDMQAMDIMPNLDVKGPGGMGLSIASVEDKKRVAKLAKQLWARGEKKLARRVAKLVKGK